jgi:hypothetical protein
MFHLAGVAYVKILDWEAEGAGPLLPQLSYFTQPAKGKTVCLIQI